MWCNVEASAREYASALLPVLFLKSAPHIVDTTNAYYSSQCVPFFTMHHTLSLRLGIQVANISSSLTLTFT